MDHLDHRRTGQLHHRRLPPYATAHPCPPATPKFLPALRQAEEHFLFLAQDLMANGPGIAAYHDGPCGNPRPEPPHGAVGRVEILRRGPGSWRGGQGAG